MWSRITSYNVCYTKLLRVGRQTDFTQQVKSMEIEHQKMQEVQAGDDVALKVYEPLREGDKIYKVLDA